jgi:hypothetical protein
MKVVVEEVVILIDSIIFSNMTLNIQKDYDLSIIINIESNVVVDGVKINPIYNIPEDYRINQIEAYLNSGYVTEISNNYITNKKIISTYEDVLEHFKPAPDKYFVTGITDSKANIIDKYFRKTDFFTATDPLKQQQQLSFKKFVGDENNNSLVEEVQTYDDNTTIRLNVKLNIPGLDIQAMVLSESSDRIVEYVLYLDTENPIKYIDLENGLSTFMYMRNHEQINSIAEMVLYDGIIDEPKITSDIFIDRGVSTTFERIKKLKNIKNLNELYKTGLGYYKINTNGYNFKNTE